MEDIEIRRRRASTLRAEADALTSAYRRATWLRFTLVFFPVPFVVVLLRLQVESWTYFLYGTAYVGLSALLYVWDSRASARCDAAEQAARQAERDAIKAKATRASSTPPSRASPGCRWPRA